MVVCLLSSELQDAPLSRSPLCGSCRFREWCYDAYRDIPRNSERFKVIFKERSATERCNALNDTYKLDRSCRNASYGLIRLTLANIVEHAVVRNLEAVMTPA